MELINAIATYFECTNNLVVIDSVIGKNCWFTLGGSTAYTCTISRGKFLKNNSIRLSAA